MRSSRESDPRESEATEERFVVGQAPVLQARRASATVAAAASSAVGQQSFVRAPLSPKENAGVATGPAAPLVPERRSSIASLAVPQPSRRVHTVSPSALRRSEAGAGHYGGLLPAAAVSVSRGNMPSATAGACGGGDACSSRQQSPGYPPVVGFGSPSPDCQYAEPSARQQQARDRRHEAPPRVECELQYRRIEMGPTSWSGNLFSGESMASPTSGGDLAAQRGHCTSFQRTKGDGWVRPAEAYDSPLSTRPVLPNSDQLKTKCGNNKDAATGAIATTTRDGLPEGAAGNRALVSPPSAAVALVPGGQLPPAARATKPPPQQPQTPPTAAAVISASRTERSLGAGSASSPILKLDAALSPDSRRWARPDESGDSLGSHAMHEMSRFSSNCAIGGSYGSTEAAATNSGATTCSRSSSAVESDVDYINSADGDIAPIPGQGHDGRTRADDGHTSSPSDPFGHGGAEGYRDAKTTSSLPTSCARSAVDSGGDLGHPTAGGVGQPQKSSGTWLDQLGATIWRDMLERRRRWVSVMLEVVIPLVCTTCAVVLWAAFGVVTSPNYSPLSSVGGRGFNFKPGRYLSAVCYNETWFGEQNFIDGLLPCRNLSASSRPVTCSSVGEEALPVKGLCYTQDGRALMAFVDGVRDGLSQVMPLDDIIAYKWLAKKLSQGPSAARSLLVGVGLASNSRFSAIQSSGKLYFAPRKYVPDDMLEYLSANAKLLQYVYNDTFDTVEAAHRVIKSGERGPTWALVNIRQLDENGFDVSIEMESMALPRLEVIIDKAYPGGPSFDRSDVYYASGYPSLMNGLMRYYFLSLSAAGATRAEMDVIQSLARRRAQQHQQQQHRTVSAGSVVVPRTTRELLNAARTVWKPVGEGIESFAGAAELGESLAPWTLQKASRILTTSAALRAKADITMYVGGLPWVPFKTSRVLTSANTVLGFVVVLAFLYPVSQLTRRLVLEKERRVREATLIMGLDSVHLWCSWLLHSAALMFTISFAMTLLMCATFLSKSDAFSVLLVVFMFALTCVPLSGLLAAFFNTSRTAALMTPLIYFAMSLILFAMRSARPSAYLGLSIFSPTCFALIMQNVLARESGDGFAVPASLDSSDNPNTAALLGFLALDLLVYLICALYADAVLPKSAGVPKHPLFFLQDPIRCCRRRRREAVRRASPQATQAPSAPMRGGGDADAKAYGASCGWCCAGRGAAGYTDDEDLCNGEDARDPNGVYEAETFAPEQLSVRIRGLRKFFRRGGRRFAAVRNFCWQIPNTGISVLLGHNGAGKSTVMHMMTGMLHPDGGDCYIGGYSVRLELARARHEIGYCPQHNILWPELSCREHLEFFARLKGLRGAALEDAVVHTLKDVDLLQKQNDPSRVLSGGMKRKLSVAIAFVGGSSLVLLDEPTAGMDVAARRHTWGLLLRMSRSRSVLLTTHFMDEADLLGDRVAIMSRGQLKCAGSSLFLKSRLGLGYNISISADAQLHVGELDAFLQQHVPQAERLASSGGEVSYRLPARQLGCFPALLGALDTVGPMIGIRGYAISPTTLEEIFIKIAHDAAEDERRQARMKQEAHRASSSAVAVMHKKGYISSLWGRLRCCCCCWGSGTGQIGRSSRDEFDWNDDDLDGGEMGRIAYGHSNSGYAHDNDRVRTQEPSACGTQEGSASPMQHQPGCLATALGRSQRYSCPAATGCVAGHNDDSASASESCTPAEYSSGFARPATSVVSDSDCRASPEDVGCGREALPSAAKYATTTSAEGAGHSMPCAPASAATTLAAAAAAATAVMPMPVTRRAPVDIIWGCEISFSTATVGLLQTEAMARKRFYNMKRDRKMLCFQIICPVACVLLAMLLSLVRVYSVAELMMNTSSYPHDTLWDATGCRGYFNSSSETAASVAPRQRMRDVNTANLSDFYYFLQDEWFAHGQVGKYSGVACGEPVLAMLPSIGRNPLVLLTNYSAYHALPIAMVNVYNLLLKAVRGPSVHVRASAATLPSTSESASEDSMRRLLMGVVIMVPFTFLPSHYISWVVKERECKSRHLQDICGLRYLIYWFSNFIFDFAAYIVTMLLVVVIFAIFQRREFVGADTIGATLTLLSVFGFCSISTAYLVQFCFTTHSSAQIVVMAVGFVSGFFLVILVFVLQLLPKTQAAAANMRKAFRAFPTYAVGEGIVNLVLLSHFQLSNPALTAFSMDTIGWPCVYMAVEGPLFLFLTLLIDHPHWRLKRRLRHCVADADAAALSKAHRSAEQAKAGGKQYAPPCDGGDPGGQRQQDYGGARATEDAEEDSDVEDERLEVRRRMGAYRADLMRQESLYRLGGIVEPISYGLEVEDAVVSNFGGVPGLGAASPIIDAVAVVGLHKRYDSGNVAVQDITFGVVPGEVFGLLGTNGAGKTTTMSILCQEFYPTAGRVYVCGYDIVSESRDALQCIGYCPQFDATLDLLTVEEHLRVFAGIRGIPREQQESVVCALLQLSGLREYAHTTSAALSGGNRRKLSVALSLIGGPPVVVLDEPSAGMDPVARRAMWTSIQAIKHRCSIVLCTHHLEEVEALADCVAIMVDGRLRCIGSKVHLKQKYGSGFEMVIRVQPPPAVKVTSSATANKGTGDQAAEAAALEAIKAQLIHFVTSSFPSSRLAEVRGKRLVFMLPKNASLPNVFQMLQANCEALCISDYTVSQTSIEQIFLRVSAEAKEAENVRAAFAERQRDAEGALRLKREQLRRKREKARAEHSTASRAARTVEGQAAIAGERREEEVAQPPPPPQP
ncbi:hypothetical protein LSCM4_08155 [Leishmania orientalis]|uniref:ABC transporter domain-containing protein n=1 Tax=Leishmania orientalis TaxID=2249476 RepID=A0A836H7E7_9TRYP|nr:hypothetical protein LSCM4_08155 [Leishmania orientalis]